MVTDDDLINKLSEFEDYILRVAKHLDFDDKQVVIKGEENLESILTDLCLLYLDSNPNQKDIISNMIKGKDRLIQPFLYYIERVSKYLWSIEDENWLWLGLTAAAIENCGSDYRDTITALEYLYFGALRANINPDSYFSSMAKIAKDGDDGRTAVGPMLRGFKEVKQKRVIGNVGKALIHKKAPDINKAIFEM